MNKLRPSSVSTSSIHDPAKMRSMPSTDLGNDKESDSTPSSELVPNLGQDHGPKQQTDDIPWRYRIAAGLMIMLFAFGSSLSETTLGPLKSTLRKELDVTSKSSSDYRLMHS
jgi:hypothetical protein